MVSMGHIPDDSLGLEASGIITRVGIDVRGFKPGDSVCTLGQGTHRSLLYNKASYCTPMPRGLSFEQAATLPLVHCTAFYALQYIARACPGQTVLIHSAAGGVGQAAIQLAQHIGLVIFATVGATEKREFIKQEFGIPEGHIFNSRDLSFAKGIKRMTSGRGVDCVINSLSGEAQRRSWECVAPGGTFVEIGMKDILANTRLEMRPFLQDATFSFFNLKNVMTNRPKVMIKVINGTFDLLRRGITRPVLPLTVYPVAQMERGFRLMQSGNHIGKIAFAWSEEENVPAELKVRASLKLDDKTTYMLVGGFGGLGRSLSKMLVELGARYLCFISRSEAQSASSLDLLQELEAKAVRTVAYKCDISNREQLAQTLVKCSQEMPRLGGVIQCAMVLRDAFFEKMTWHEWRESLQPKVLGSWNLHLLLPKPLDFFIMLSSFAGIFGNRGQSNYGAAGAYQDALAHHRQSLGLKAVTIDLGIVRDVGVLAKAGNAKSHIKEWGEHFGMRESELHCLIKYVIHNEVSTNANTETAPSTTTSSTPSQILTGFATGGAAEGAGIEQPYYLSDPRFSVLAQTGLNTRGGPPTSAEKSAKLPLRDLLMHCPSFADAQRLVTQAMKSHVERMLQAAVGEIDGTRPLHSYGIDSLVGVEITNWIYRETKVQLSIMEVLASMPMVELAGKIAVKSPFCAKEASGAQT